MSPDKDFDPVPPFVARWKASAAAERANCQTFLSELCDVLGVERPQPAQAEDEKNEYVFERAVTFDNGDGTFSTGRIDLYKRGCFVLEAKQGSEPEAAAAAPLFGGAPVVTQRRRKGRRGTAVRGTRGWDVAMRQARGQAEQYVRALPASEGNPPFVVVVDVGHTFELYSDFSRAGKTYVPFPDARSHRIPLEDLGREETRERLRRVWTDPLALDPARQSARVTREMAERLASLARSLEGAGHTPERVAHFLMRSIFTMFAEDMRLLPARGWTGLLESLRGSAEKFPAMVSELWGKMNTGGFSVVLREELLRFNGGLFESVEALPVSEAQLGLLIEASRLDWREVEPAIFGTLLERALEARERQKLGAHYTPRAYVERLVMPAVIEPLREEWDDTLAAAVTLQDGGQDVEAARAVKEFHRRLCRVRVLDPACGSGNFLYVTLEHLKRLEGEVLDALHGFGESQGVLEDAGMTVDPHQLLGLELNPRAAAIADLVLWIGYLQWHFRTRGEAPPAQPVLRKFDNIEQRDAVLTYDAVEPATDDDGRPLTRWDGRTYRKSPVTGEDVPDETARVPVLRYTNPRPAVWPEADFIIGNPPFIGKLRLLSNLGEGYVEALREAYEDEVPDGADFVMYWWYHAAKRASEKRIKRFGLITTNSITQTFNRRVVSKALEGDSPIHLVFAVPDHPWVDESGSAAVRISMTVGEAGNGEGTLATIATEKEGNSEEIEVELLQTKGQIHEDLRVGADVASAGALTANSGIASTGLILGGRGFVLTADEAERYRSAEPPDRKLIYPLKSGRDLVDEPRNLFVIDTNGWTEEELRTQAPEIYQRLLERVFPERQTNRDPRLRKQWWLFRRSNEQVRRAMWGLRRYIGTTETTKHRVFSFLLGGEKPEHTIIVIGLDDAFMLGVLSSRVHLTWALAAGGTLEDRPRYNKSLCFDPFPFPDATDEQKARIRALGEALDAHRKRQQEQHPRLTVTEMYNVLEKLRAGESLTERDRLTHEAGLVSVLRQIHDDLDAAVADAYGWTGALADEEILARLVRLNGERAAEERRGLVRWLRPEFQRPAAGVATRFGEGFEPAAPARTGEKRQPWPKTLPEQARALRQTLAAQKGVSTPEELARKFVRARVERVEELLQTLVSLGQAREVEAGRYVV